MAAAAGAGERSWARSAAARAACRTCQAGRAGSAPSQHGARCEGRQTRDQNCGLNLHWPLRVKAGQTGTQRRHHRREKYYLCSFALSYLNRRSGCCRSKRAEKGACIAISRSCNFRSDLSLLKAIGAILSNLVEINSLVDCTTTLEVMSFIKAFRFLYMFWLDCILLSSQ